MALMNVATGTCRRSARPPLPPIPAEQSPPGHHQPDDCEDDGVQRVPGGLRERR